MEIPAGIERSLYWDKGCVFYMPCQNFRLRRKRHMADKCGEAAFALSGREI